MIVSSQARRSETCFSMLAVTAATTESINSCESDCTYVGSIW